MPYRRPPPAKVASTSSSMLFGKPLTLCQLLRLRSSMPRSSWAKSVMKMSEKSITTAALASGSCAMIGSAIRTESV